MGDEQQTPSEKEGGGVLYMQLHSGNVREIHHKTRFSKCGLHRKALLIS